MVFENNERLMSSRVITGKKTTPTPTLTSVIGEVILYPYWVVPYKIATMEILPRVKRDISYLERFHFQVIDSRGRLEDPKKIRWQSLSSYNFPYTLRQATGCDNSLGLVKFDFQNPFSVYLHDTPARELFEMNRRFFSHGCMRVEKPVELARLLLDNNKQAIDTLTEKGCLFNLKPINVPAEKKASLAVLYSTAWFDETGEIVFYEDVYGKREMKK
jgi:murein L,D-transpeptidase YcbB/YkuD